MVRSINDVVAMVEAVCRLPSNVPALRRLDAGIKFPEFKRAVADHDSAFLYGWLMEIFSLQGISDANAFSYIETHGNAEWKQVKKLLAKGPQACAKLKTFADFKNCGFRKTAGTCNVPELLEACAVPQLPLRKGDLNQLAFSLFLFIRDVCKGDLIGFIDTTIAEAKASETDDPERAARHALIKAFKPIFGVGTKLIAMSLASILIAGGRARPDWVKLGRSMIVVDSLVHNFLHRSGILAAYRKSHAYGPACYGKKGCEIVLRDIASKIDLKTIDPRLPSHHPRMVQSAIWRLCAEWGLDLCNGCQIDDTKRCGLTDCPVRSLCSRRVLFPKKPEAALVVPPPDDGPMIEAGSQGESNTLAPEDEGTSPKGFRGRGGRPSPSPSGHDSREMGMGSVDSTPSSMGSGLPARGKVGFRPMRRRRYGNPWSAMPTGNGGLPAFISTACRPANCWPWQPRPPKKPPGSPARNWPSSPSSRPISTVVLRLLKLSSPGSSPSIGGPSSLEWSQTSSAIGRSSGVSHPSRPGCSTVMVPTGFCSRTALW